MTRTPAWKAARAERRARERADLEWRREIAAQLREADRLCIAFDEMQAALRYEPQKRGTKYVTADGSTYEVVTT